MFKKIIKFVFSALPYVLFVIAIALIAEIVIALTTDRAPRILGTSIFIVVTPSMEDTIMTGDLIFVKTIDPLELIVGDIVTFRKSATENELITHRIIAINDSGATRTFTTKGDNNDVSLVWEVDFPADQIVGVYAGKSELLGYVYKTIFTSETGMPRFNFLYGIAVIVFLAIAYTEMRIIFKEIAQHKKQVILEEKAKMLAEELKKLQIETENKQE